MTDRPMKAPLHNPGSWGGFFHMLARHYQDYEWAVQKASHRRKRKAVDVDGQHSREGTGWALHWATVGQNHLHDPLKHISRHARIDDLTDTQIARLRGPKGQRPDKLSHILELADRKGVRVELEVKTVFGHDYLTRLFAKDYVQRMQKHRHLQFKTLATMGDPVTRLRPVHDLGGVTILSFSTWTARTTRAKKGISKARAWPVTDYYRGHPRWVA